MVKICRGYYDKFLGGLFCLIRFFESGDNWVEGWVEIGYFRNWFSIVNGKSIWGLNLLISKVGGRKW